MSEGKIELDSKAGKEIGFTSNLFDGWLWLKDGYVYVSYISSKQKNKGNLKKLFDAIQKKGYGIKVPTPSNRMAEICLKNGFKTTREWFAEAGEHCDILQKEWKEKGACVK